MRFRLLSLALLFAVPLSAQRIHPTAENLDVTATSVVSRRDTVSGDPVLDRMAARLRALSPERHLGGEDGAGGADFGKIGDVTVDTRGRVLVLDLQDKAITRWTAAGAPAGRFGRAGGGPLEFNYPTHLAVQADGTLLVLDRALGIRRIRWETEPTYRDTWMEGQTGDALCTHGTGVVMMRRGDDGTVGQVADARGARIRGIGVGYQAFNEMAKVSLSRGMIACLHDGGYATTSILLPFVRFWTAVGTAGPVVRIADFSPMVVKDVDGGLSFSMSANGYHTARALTPLGADLLLVQFTFEDRQSSREHAEYREIQSYLLSTRNGRGVYVGTSLPLVLPLADGGFVGWHNDPVPEVVFLR